MLHSRECWADAKFVKQHTLSSLQMSKFSSSNRAARNLFGKTQARPQAPQLHPFQDANRLSSKTPEACVFSGQRTRRRDCPRLRPCEQPTMQKGVAEASSPEIVWSLQNHIPFPPPSQTLQLAQGEVLKMRE